MVDSRCVHASMMACRNRLACGGETVSMGRLPKESWLGTRSSRRPSIYSKIMDSAQDAAEWGETAVSGLTRVDSAKMEREGRRWPGTVDLEVLFDC